MVGDIDQRGQADLHPAASLGGLKVAGTASRLGTALTGMAPALVPVLARGVHDPSVGLEELVRHLKDRQHQPALRAPCDMTAPGLAPDEFTGLRLDALCRSFLVHEVALENIGLLDPDVLMIGQHRARLEPHQGGHQSGATIEQQSLGLATGKARLLPLHALRANQMLMCVGAYSARRGHSVHATFPYSSSPDHSSFGSA